MSNILTTKPQGGFPQSSFKYTPLQHVRTLYTRFVQGLFYASPPGFYHWDPDLALSEIVISDENPINVEQIGTRPAISFTRGPAQFYSLGLDDMMDYSFQTSAKKKSVLVPSTMTINCCSRVDIESENLAWVVAEHLWLLREVLMKMGFFEIGRQPIIGSPSKAGSLVAGDGADEWFCTSVACPFQFYRTSQVTPLNSHVAQNIELALQAALHPVQQGQFPNAFSHEVAIGMTTCPPDSFAAGASDSRGNTPDATGRELQQLPLIPHPLNPAVRVHVRSSRPYGPALKPPSMGGRVLPISQPCVEESTSHVTDPSTHKV